MPEESVKVNYTYMGGGFGRRSMTDVSEEATDLSMQIRRTRQSNMDEGR